MKKKNPKILPSGHKGNPNLSSDFDPYQNVPMPSGEEPGSILFSKPNPPLLKGKPNGSKAAIVAEKGRPRSRA